MLYNNQFCLNFCLFCVLKNAFWRIILNASCMLLLFHRVCRREHCMGKKAAKREKEERRKSNAETAVPTSLSTVGSSPCTIVHTQIHVHTILELTHLLRSHRQTHQHTQLGTHIFVCAIKTHIQ